MDDMGRGLLAQQRNGQVGAGIFELAIDVSQGRLVIQSNDLAIQSLMPRVVDNTAHDAIAIMGVIVFNPELEHFTVSKHALDIWLAAR
jgi:hypothetical protein